MTKAEKAHFPGPAGNNLANAAKSVIGFCCCEDTWLAHIQVGAHQDSHAPFLQSYIPAGQPQPILLQGGFPSQLRTWLSFLLNFHWPSGGSCQPISPSYHIASVALHSTWFGSDQKLAESALSVVQVTKKDIEYYLSQYWSLRDVMTNQPQPGIWYGWS